MMMPQPQIILLKDGTDTSQGIPQLVSNINACTVVADNVRTTLGPRGMDKLVVDESGKVTISNDGATIMKLLQIVHPAAVTLVDIARSQDAEVGDGTTSVVLLACEILKEVKAYVEDRIHPQVIIKAFRKALALSQAELNRIAIRVNRGDPQEVRDMLERCASTAMNSKLIANSQDYFKKLVVDAVMALDDDLPLDMIGMKRIQGGSLEDTMLIRGVAFEKGFSYAGFEMQPKQYTDPKICILNVELELKAERENAEIRVGNMEEYEKIYMAEWKILYDKLEKIVASGAKVVLSKLRIGDVATQFFADRDVFCCGPVKPDDIKRTIGSCGGAVLTSVNDITDESLGRCGNFEEQQIGKLRYNVFTGCDNAKAVTIIMRGGAEQFMAETQRSLHDAIMIVRRAMKHDLVVAGGGAIEMELCKYLRAYARTIPGKEQLLIQAFAKSLEVIPRQLCINAGFDPTDIVNQLRQKHSTEGNEWWGVDIDNESISDNYEKFIWEPALIKMNALTAATEAACMVLSVDETVRNPSSAEAEAARGRGRGRGRGR